MRPFLRFQQMIQHTIVQETAFDFFHTAHPHSMKQEIVDVIHLKFLEGIVVHLQGLFPAPGVWLEVGNLGGYVVFVTGMAVQGNTCHPFALSVTIHGSGIEIVYAMLDGIVHQPVHPFLVDDTRLLVAEGELAHTSISQQRHLVAGGRGGSIGHASLLLTLGSGGFRRGGMLVRLATAQCRYTGNGHGCMEASEKFTTVDRVVRWVFLFHDNFIL